MASPQEFKFTSVWEIPTDLITVWNHIGRVTKYPLWWPDVKEVTLIKGPELPVTVGTKAAYKVASPLYVLSYETEVQDYELGKHVSAASTGDLNGTGTWRFKETKNGIELTFDWYVSLKRSDLQALSGFPFVRNIMGFFHERVMKRGETGLQKLVKLNI